MIVVRDVFQAKFGKGNDLMALFKEAKQKIPNLYGDRVLTDASGSFDTVIAETDVTNLAEWEKRIADVFASREFGQWFTRMQPLVDSGRREFYNLETLRE
jgi:hypothetical protein